MTLKKKYFQPKIDQIEIDISISMQAISENTTPGDPFGAASTIDSEKEVSSFKETDNSGFNEDPFKR